MPTVYQSDLEKLQNSTTADDVPDREISVAGFAPFVLPEKTHRTKETETGRLTVPSTLTVAPETRQE
jgi:hypothetical protein